DPGVTVHRLPDHFGPRSLARLGWALDRLPTPRRLLVQFVPHAFGCKALNLPFGLWLLARRDPGLSVIFHEVAFPWHRGQPLRHQLLGAGTHARAALGARAARRAFVPTPAWAPQLLRLARPGLPVTWLPVPSNLPTEVAPEAVAAARRELAPDPGAEL